MQEYDEEEGNPANALDEILQEPEKLAELDLDAFAEELERQGFGKKHITLQVYFWSGRLEKHFSLTSCCIFNFRT